MDDRARDGVYVQAKPRVKIRTTTDGDGEAAADVRLHRATSEAELKKLLFEVTDHNALDVNGDAPLHCFVKRKDKGKFNCLITFLIHSKCDVNLLNKDGQTALHLACQSNDIEVAKALIAFDAKINSINVVSKTPLDIVLNDLDDDSDELEILLLFLGALRCEEISRISSRTERGADGVTHNGAGIHTNAEVDDDNEHTTKAPDISESGHRQKNSDGEEQGLKKAPKSDHDKTNESPVTSPSRDELLSRYLSTVAEEPSEGKLEKHTAIQSTPDSCDQRIDISDIVLTEKAIVEENGKIPYSGSRASFEATGSQTESEKEGSKLGRPEEQPEERYTQKHRAQTSPEQMHLYGANRPRQRIHLNRRQHGKIAVRRRNIFRRQNSGLSVRSVSEYNPEMEVMQSTVGQSVVPVCGCQRQEGLRILCLDGGGMKGLIQIEMLKMIEQMTGKRISELFDWIVGTSTGGILALGMIYSNLSLESFRRVYFGMKDTVFKRQSKLISHICDTKALEDLLKGTLGTEKTMDSVKKPNVLIAAVNKSTTYLPLVFFNNCLDNGYSNNLVWKVARYTSAAPVFFAECDNYIDGGVKANNPTTFGLAEIQDFLAKKHGRGSAAAKISCVVSLGCGIYPPEPLGNTDIADALKTKKIHKVPGRLKELLTLLTTALSSSEEISRLCRINCEHQGITYFRFSPEIGEEVGTTEKDNHKLCQIVIRAKQLFKENAEQVESMIKQLGSKIEEDYMCHI